MNETTPQNTTLVEPGVYQMNLGKGTDGLTDTYKYVNNRGEAIANYTPKMQSTAMATRQDQETAKKIDTMVGTATGATNTANATPQNPNVPTVDPNAKQTFKSPDGKIDISETPLSGGYSYKTPPVLKDGQKVGYGTDSKRYLINKDGTTKNDPFGDQEYATNEREITRERERNDLFTSLKTNLDSAHAGLLDSITKTFAVRKSKMENINKRYLALKESQGFDSGQARYMSEVNTGVLQDEEEQGQMRLAELDAQELSLRAQAIQAKTEKDFDLATKKLTEIDKVRKEKEDAIQNIHKNAVDYSKAIDDQEKELRNIEKENFARGEKSLKTSAPALFSAYNSLKTQKEKDDFVIAMAKKMKVDVSMVLGTIQDEQTQSTKAIADAKAQQALIDQRNRSNQPDTDEDGNPNPKKKGTMTERRSADIKAIIDDFANNIKAKGWKGANPKAYEYYKKQILDLYGTAGVTELEKAMETQNIEIDYTNK